jgi:sec-independent protein translocase protein TatB
VFGLGFDKLIVIGFIAVLVIGPQRLPHYASVLAKMVTQLRGLADGARERMRDEMGPDFDDVDWTKLDPRQYDPRRIIREALLDTEEEPRVKPVTTPESAARKRAAAAGEPTPYDTEST